MSKVPAQKYAPAEIAKDRNDPGRFFGDGVIFKAKLIGILEVGEARGDRMCQEALQDLKMAIRAAGEHKQRITIHVTIDGLRLRDEKTGDSLYHHPVHKISFIAQDMTDSRAFGYIFGSPDSGHRFFGIKTDKAASQVVLAMRDLFQVVFELKKKEIEMARQQIQSKIIHEHQPITLNVKSTGTDPLAGYSKTETGKSNTKEMSPESVADLVDLEQELSSIQRGITQMERITPNEPTVSLKGLSEEDPFGDSFTIFPTYQLLPPPESSRSRHSKPVKPPDTISETPAPSFSTNQPLSNLVATATTTTTTTITHSSENWLENRTEVSPIPFEPPKSLDVSSSAITTAIVATHITEDIPMQKTDLDPLGTGKSKPYIDKKYFFHELKNPPKKVLKELSGQEGIFAATFRENDSSSIDVFENSSDSFESTTNAENKSSDFATKIYPETNFERAKMDEPIMMPRDTDPFSPTRKKSDPFQEGDIFSKLDPFEFDFGNKPTVLPETKIVSSDESSTKPKKDMNVFNGPLQVNLPPESWSSGMAPKKIERQTSESPTSSSRNRPSVFKQNTVDVISSISSKKMPHLFGQKFSKRDSNSINMRRLQESDSLSENETAPEPPPRPDSASHVEPPPLPPKKQFSDIVIRPRITSSSAIPPPTRYDYVTSKMKSNQSLDSAPPIPLPSRKVGRSDTSYPGPGRPSRKPGEEDDYLTPISSRSDVPPLLPPPQTKGRGRRYEYLEHKTEPEIPIVNNEIHNEPILPDITLSQLLTLGIDELATKLNVPTSKLSTMTLVELTTYLSDFIETAKRHQEHQKHRIEEPPVFKVNFDQNSDATFVAKFDDNFGEELSTPFIANFSNFDAKPEEQSTAACNLVPSADRYAVFREIIELEKQNDDSEQVDSSGQEDEANNPIPASSNETLQSNEEILSNVVPVAKIDTKITEAISHAKDRYAALRDIILVEDLFDKSTHRADSSLSSNLMEDGDKDDEHDVFEEAENDKSINDETSPENNSNSGEGLDNGELTRKTPPDLKQNGLFTMTVSNNDDLEIDEYMNRAISNLSLDSRGDRLTPGVNKSPTVLETGTSPKPGFQRKSPLTPLNTHAIKSQFNDMSTSPIPIQKSPASKSPLFKSPLSKSPLTKSPIPHSAAVTNLIDAKKRPNSGSLSDVICGSSPEADNTIPEQSSQVAANVAAAESWAIFEKSIDKKPPTSSQPIKSPKVPNKELPESPCSSDGKDEWKSGQEYAKKWPKGQTSSSSRDLSPWDDEALDYKKRPPTGTDRHGYYMRHARRMNSCDDDYDYEEDVSKRRERRIKGPTNRSRENFDSDSQNWYHPTNHHHWSPPEEDDNRPRTFDRNLYERGTYGPPPFDKRDHKVSSHLSYDRRDYKNYDKRKYYREYARPDYDFESYGESPDMKDRKMMYYGDSFEKTKCRRDYENMYEEGFQRDGRGHKSRDFFYDRDRKSFDRDSVESYDSATRRHKSFGSGDVYGSLDSREEFRERYMGVEKTRSLRKNIKIRGNEDYEQDSETEVQVRRGPGDTRSLQRPTQSARVRKSSGSSPWDGEDPVPPPIPGPGQKGWKRPSSASESERRLAENRRVLCHTLSGSDGEKDRRFRRKSRTRGKEDPRQQNFGTSRYPPHRDENYEYIDYDEYGVPQDEDKFERLNRRRQDMHQRMMEAERRKKGEKFGFDDDDDTLKSKYVAKKDTFYADKDRHTHKFDAFEEPKSGKSLRREFDFDDFEDTPRSNASSNKFNFEEHGFESDFNSPPPTTATSNTTKSSFRFSNDFSEKEKSTSAVASFETDFNQTPTQKLRFDDNVTVSKFENEKPDAFEDDFSKAEFVQENEDRWTTELPKKNSLRLTKRQEQIKKSESVNIFGRKSEDPFEDDDFFKSSSPPAKEENEKKKRSDGGFQWDNDFAKFDENM